MAIIYADQVTEIAMIHDADGIPFVNVLHFYNDEQTNTDEEKARDFVDNWQDHIVPRMDGRAAFTGANWRSLDRDDLNQGFMAPDPAKPMGGTVTGQGAPPNVAILVKKITNNRQRGQRDGRIFWGPAPIDSVTETGDLNATWRNSFQTDWDDFLSGVNDNDFGVGGGSGLVVLNTTPESRIKGGQEVDLTYRTVSALVVDPRAASQRDRLR